MKKLLLTAALALMAFPANAQDYVKATLSDKEQREHYNADATEAFTISYEDCGKTFNLNLAAGFDVTFPDGIEGCKVKFYLETALTGDYYRLVSDGSNVFKGVLIDSSGGAATSTTGTDTIRFISANAVAGDSVSLESTGDVWFLNAFTNASGAIDFSS